jgi:hypothetical protein
MKRRLMSIYWSLKIVLAPSAMSSQGGSGDVFTTAFENGPSHRHSSCQAGFQRVLQLCGGTGTAYFYVDALAISPSATISY